MSDYIGANQAIVYTSQKEPAHLLPSSQPGPFNIPRPSGPPQVSSHLPRPQKQDQATPLSRDNALRLSVNMKEAMAAELAVSEVAGKKINVW